MKMNLVRLTRLGVVSGIFGLFLFSSCKKSHPAAPSTPINNNNPTALSDEDSLKYYINHDMLITFTSGADTIYQLPLYLWYAQVPSIDPFSASYPKAEDLLNAIISYPKNSQNGAKLDRYSFLDRTGSVSGLIQGGYSGDMGFNVSYAEDSAGNTYLYVIYVYKNSSAGIQGVQRGWEVTAVNGNYNVSYDLGSFGNGSGANVSRVENALYNSPSSQFTFLRPGGSSDTLTIDATTYNVTPVLFDTIYQVGGTPVGYFVFNQFLDVQDSLGNPTETQNELSAVFNKFSAAGVRDVIMDERYNGGGATNTAAYIDNALAPAAASNRVMYNYAYNDKLTADETSLGLPTTINFGNTGNLNLDHIFFVTSRYTVSASELTLNNLKPYMDVQLVGDTTYGKPVGFFAWPIYDYDSLGKQQHLADLYSVNFQTSNANGVGSYFTGIPPNFPDYDNFSLSWGDPNDPALKSIFAFINTGTYARTGARQVNTGRQLRAIPTPALRRPGFQGMVDYQTSRKFRLNVNQGLMRRLH